MAPRKKGLKTQVSNKTRGQTTVTIGNLSVEGREDLYEEISCEIEDVEEDGGEMKEADDDDGEGGDGSDESGSSSSEEEPDDDGMGGGILGILVGLSGEGGMSDLGTLLTTVSGIITNLSGGPEFDLDTIIGSAVGLFAGVSGGDGTIPFGKLSAQYYITSFEGFSGGGAMLNGKFIGDLLNGIITGSSLVEDEEDYDAEPTKDSITFYRALFAALFGSNSENEGGGDGGDY